MFRSRPGRGSGVLALLWMRFLCLGPLGKAVAVIALLYGTGWLAGTLSWHSMARQLGSAALLILSVLVTERILRWIWNSYTGPRES